jgi:nucleoside phosphorylase
MPIECMTCKATTAVSLQTVVEAPNPVEVDALPSADFLMVTWTAAETNGMAVVFGQGQYQFHVAATTNFSRLVLPNLSLPLEATCHAYFFVSTVNGKKVVCLKSEFHPKEQTAATTMFFERIAGSEAHPNFKYVLTTGTSGGIWASLDVGDVVVSNKTRYGLTMPKEKQKQIFTGVSNVKGSNPPAGSATWYDYVNEKILATDACVKGGLVAAGGRNAASGSSKIYYKATGAELIDVVTNSRISDDEYGRLAFYRTQGATFDENDAYVAEALKSVNLENWVSIRNISDLPSPVNNDAQYDNFGPCSSINGAYACWAFVMGHA